MRLIIEPSGGIVWETVMLPWTNQHNKRNRDGAYQERVNTKNVPYCNTPNTQGRPCTRTLTNAPQTQTQGASAQLAPVTHLPNTHRSTHPTAAYLRPNTQGVQCILCTNLTPTTFYQLFAVISCHVDFRSAEKVRSPQTCFTTHMLQNKELL